MKYVTALVLAVSACAPPTKSDLRPPLAAADEEDWSMFRDDAERTGFAEGSVVGDRVTKVWQIPSFNTSEYGAAKGSPSIVGDVVYCGTDTGRFVAAHVSDGHIVWQVQLEPTSHGIHGSPAVAKDMVYIGAYDGTLYAFERRTGLLRWRQQRGYQVGASPAVVPEWGLVFSAHEEPDGTGRILALDAHRGDVVWQQATRAHPHSSVAVDVAAATVFVGDNQGVVYAFDAHSGEARWQRVLDGAGDKADVKTTPTVVAELGLVVVGAWSGKIHALDGKSGAPVWEHEVGGKIMSSTAYSALGKTLYVGTPDGRLIALDATNGRLRFQHAVPARIMSSPAVSGDGRAVVFGASDGRVYALSADSGEELWSTFVGGQVTGSPALVGSRIYVTSKKGGLWSLETRQGDVASDDTQATKAARSALVAELRASGRVRDERVLDAIAAVPRHLFVESGTRDAYVDRVLPIGYAQTISQPLIVAMMTEALALTGKERVLEIGTGSGYQAAVLSVLAGRVYSIEIVPALAEQARARFAELGYAVEQRIGDGGLGWPEQAPFDRIILTAAPKEVPAALFRQLAVGGILVAPVGEDNHQRLVRYQKDARGERVQDLGGVRFVPFVGATGGR